MSEVGHDITEHPPEEPRSKRARQILMAFLGVSLVIWLLSGIYQVPSGHVAVVERLGQFLGESDGKVPTIGYGLHYHLPWPIDKVTMMSTQQQYTLQVDAFKASPQEYADYKQEQIRRGADPVVLDALLDPYVITADKSIAKIEINVLFQIDDPVAWLKSVSHEHAYTYDPSSTSDMRNQMFQQIAQRVIVAQVSRTPLEQLLLSGKEELARRIQDAFQQGTNIGTASSPAGISSLGISIQQVSVTAAEVPERVKGAYTNLITQSQNARTVVVKARGDADTIVQRAEGEKQTLLTSANLYRTSAIDAARGEADRFSQIYGQYQNAPALMRINLWLDAARTVYGSVKRIYFVQPGQKTTIIVDPPTFDSNQATRPANP